MREMRTIPFPIYRAFSAQIILCGSRSRGVAPGYYISRLQRGEATRYRIAGGSARVRARIDQLRCWHLVHVNPLATDPGSVPEIFQVLNV